MFTIGFAFGAVVTALNLKGKNNKQKSLKYHHGNQCNVMGEILLSRYVHFINNHILTHATTNLSVSKLENYYGNRVRSRMREIFNLIAFDSNSIDKRR